MTEILLLKFVHVLLFVYWLGGDLGVFYSSNYVVNPDISVESRQVAAKIMFWLDQAPRLCMTLILPVGLHLAVALGEISMPTQLLALIWVICLFWFANVIVLHEIKNTRIKQTLTALDYWFRLGMVGLLIVVAGYALATNQLIESNWLAAKLLIFAGLVACGLIIRTLLKPFIPAFAAMVRDGATHETNNIMQAALARCRYFVVAIWIGLLANAALGLHLISID